MVIIIESMAHAFYLAALAHLVVVGAIIFILAALIYMIREYSSKDTKPNPEDKP